MYHDPYNDNFDRESDEDFVLDSSPENARATRRTIRRQSYNNNNRRNQEEQKVSQTNARTLRRLNRNRRRNNSSDNEDYKDEHSREDPNDFKLDDESEEHADSDDDYSEEYVSEKRSKNKNPKRNHNFYSSPNKLDESEEEMIMQSNLRSDSKTCPNNSLFGCKRVIVEEVKNRQISIYSNFIHQNNSEDYKFESELTTDDYRIDVEEALKMNNTDKSQLDCMFCKKKKGEESLLGPFKFFIKNQPTEGMIYWIHRQCLERNDIIKQVNRYEFKNVSECIDKFLNSDNPNCTRCGLDGATISCYNCKEYYHGYRCSYLRMAKDYKGHFVCLR